MRHLVDSAGATAIPNPVESTALSRPNHLVLVTDDGTWTARELRDAVARFAARLRSAGVEPRSRVGLIGPPSAEWVIAAHAIGWLGASVTPLAFDQPTAELEKAVAVAMPSAVVMTRGHDVNQRDELNRITSNRVFDMSSLTGQEQEECPERFWPWEEERATLLTSGTTGVSQPVSLTTAQLTMSAFASSIRLGHDLDDQWLTCLPLHHVGGFSILFRAALGGTTVVLHPRFVATRVAKALDAGEVSLVSLVPTMLERVLDVRGDVPFPERLRAILVGGAGVSADLLDRARTARAPVALTWGMTETSSQITTRFAGDLNPEAGSGPPLPFSRVQSEEDTGTLTVFSPTARGVHRTRDLGHITEEHNVVVTGRRDDTIVSGGENIAPSEVENVLRSHSGVRDAIVVGVPNIRWGERPVALLVAKEAALEADELREWCRERLAGFKVPERFLWVDEIPLGPLGKKPRARARQLAKKIAPELFDGEDSKNEAEETSKEQPV
ncbi:MAG: AMP-binding protein [Myxococcota bacterium]